MTSPTAGLAAWRNTAGFAVLTAVAALPSVAYAQDSVQLQPAPLAAAPVAGSLDDRDRALDCMSVAIAYEAAGQPMEGQQAVGQVILNRMRDPRFPKTVCGVVFQGSERLTGCQFTFTCDGSFKRHLPDSMLNAVRGIAETVIDGLAPDRVAGATHYHADYVMPYWAASGLPVARIGAHIFYRMPGDAWRPVEAAHLVGEPEMAAMQRLSGHGHGDASRVTLAEATPATPKAVFAPWGLAVASAPQR